MTGSPIPLYEPLVSWVRMSDQGFWLVGVSTSPGRVITVMIGNRGVDRESATKEAMIMLPHTGAPYRHSDQQGNPTPASGGHPYNPQEGDGH